MILHSDWKRCRVFETTFAYQQQIQNDFKRFRTCNMHIKGRGKVPKKGWFDACMGIVHIKYEIDRVHWTDICRKKKTGRTTYTRAQKKNWKRKRKNYNIGEENRTKKVIFILVWVDKTVLWGISWVPTTKLVFEMSVVSVCCMDISIVYLKHKLHINVKLFPVIRSRSFSPSTFIAQNSYRMPCNGWILWP